jgi:hypothetical protein
MGNDNNQPKWALTIPLAIAIITAISGIIVTLITTSNNMLIASIPLTERAISWTETAQAIFINNQTKTVPITMSMTPSETSTEVITASATLVTETQQPKTDLSADLNTQSIIPSAIQDLNSSAFVNSNAVNPIGNGRLRVYFPREINYDEIARIELELVFDNSYITPTPIVNTPIAPISTSIQSLLTTTSTEAKTTATLHVPEFETDFELIEFYPEMGASLLCQTSDFTGCTNSSIRSITMKGTTWSWTISPNDKTQNIKNLQLELWREAGNETVETIWSSAIQIKVQAAQQADFVELLRLNTAAFIGVIATIIAAIISTRILFRTNHQNKKIN